MSSGTIIEFRPRERAGEVAVCEAQPRERIGGVPWPTGRPAAVKGKRAPIEARWQAWRNASRRLDFLEALDKLKCSAAGILEADPSFLIARQFVDPGKPVSDVFWEMRDKLMAARADLILTPVVNKGQLAEKHRLLKWCRGNLPITSARIDAALAADEAYLALPRGKRADALRGKVVRS